MKCFALLFLVALLVCSVCVTGYIKTPSEIFSPRLTAPLCSNRCYYSSNIFHTSGYGLPNCTAYAWGRAYEIMGEKPKLSLGNARDWYDYNKQNKIYPYGKTPKVGAIACFDNSQGGHVAVVEKIENGTITLSNSAYGGSLFYLSYADVSDVNPGQDGWVFQGYIYLKNDTASSAVLNAERTVHSSDGLNLRGGIGLNSNILQVIPDNYSLYISELYSLDGYTWGKTTYNGQSGYCAIEYTG